MARLVTGTLLLPDGTPMSNAHVYFTAKRTEPNSIVKAVNTFFNTGANGTYSQNIINGWYSVSIDYVLADNGLRRWALGDVFIEDGPTATLNELIIAGGEVNDPNIGLFQQILAEAQEARDEAIAAAAVAQDAAATISPSKREQWDAAYEDRMKWSGSAEGLDAAVGRASLQLKSAALQESSVFATAAQGLAADEALENSNTALEGLSEKINTAEKGAANGVATLGANALIPPGQLPSYVDDVVEVEEFSDLPVEGESGKIYIVKAAGTDGGDPFPANQQFRWSGTVYIKLVASPGTTDNVAEGVNNLYHTQERVRTSLLTGFKGAVVFEPILESDSILQALQKVQGWLDGIGNPDHDFVVDYNAAKAGQVEV